jgi:hypothetical protein
MLCQSESVQSAHLKEHMGEIGWGVKEGKSGVCILCKDGSDGRVERYQVHECLNPYSSMGATRHMSLTRDMWQGGARYGYQVLACLNPYSSVGATRHISLTRDIT